MPKANRPKLIDDVRMTWPRSALGPPIVFTNTEIRRMLELARADQKDVFCDLGCGWAQNLLVAATEFGVRRCIGVELRRSRYLKAQERVKRWALSRRIRIVLGDLEEFIDRKDSGIEDATIIFYGLNTSPDLLSNLSRKLRRGCRLVYYRRALFPEIKPDAARYPFYVSVFPFKRPESELDWLTSVVNKRTSSLVPGKRPTVEELWHELHHDYEVLGLRGEIRKYHRRLSQVLESGDA